MTRSDDNEDEIPQANSVTVGTCRSCHGAHIVLLDIGGEPMCEGVIDLSGAESFCNAVLQAVGSPMRVRHEH